MVVKSDSDPDPATDAAYAAEMESWKLDAEREANPLHSSLIDWDEFWGREHDEEWLCEPIFALGRTHAIYAAAKVGKSWITLAACAAIATGRPFLHRPAGNPQHVLYVDYEMSEADLQQRLISFGYGPDDDLSHLHYALLPSLPPLDTEDGGRALMISAQAVGAVFVIIDTIGRAISISGENSSEAIQAFYRWTGRPLKAAGIGWARLAHAGKAGNGGGQRGSSAANEDVDIVWAVSRTDDGQKLKATHRRVGWVPETVDITIPEDDDGQFTFNITGGRSYPEGTAELVALMDSLQIPVETSREAIRKQWDKVTWARDRKMSAAIGFRRRRDMETALAAVDESVKKPVPDGGHGLKSDGHGNVPGTVGHESPETLVPHGGTGAGTDGHGLSRVSVPGLVSIDKARTPDEPDDDDDANPF